MILKIRGSIPLFHPKIILLEWKKWDIKAKTSILNDYSFFSINKTKKNLFINFYNYSDLFSEIWDDSIEEKRDPDLLVYRPIEQYSEFLTNDENTKLYISQGGFLRKLEEFNIKKNNSKKKIYYYMLQYLLNLQQHALIDKFNSFSNIFLNNYDKIFKINLTSFIIFKTKNLTSLYLILKFFKFKEFDINFLSSLNFLIFYNLLINFGGTKNKKTVNIKKRIKKKIIKMYK